MAKLSSTPLLKAEIELNSEELHNRFTDCVTHFINMKQNLHNPQKLDQEL
jgi:hypothetical protein